MPKAPERMIPVNEPLLNSQAMKYVEECLRTGWVSSEGRFIAFQSSATDLVPNEATNGTDQVYLFDRATGRRSWTECCGRARI